MLPSFFTRTNATANRIGGSIDTNSWSGWHSTTSGSALWLVRRDSEATKRRKAVSVGRIYPKQHPRRVALLVSGLFLRITIISGLWSKPILALVHLFAFWKSVGYLVSIVVRFSVRSRSIESGENTVQFFRNQWIRNGGRGNLLRALSSCYSMSYSLVGYRNDRVICVCLWRFIVIVAMVHGGATFP